jgi:energy-coupling factor transporter ATP-binding protein EcfA2
MAAYKNQRERIEQLEAFINRFRYQATKAKQVQSRIKELEKIERIEIPPEEQTIHFSFPQPKPSGRIVAEFKDVSKYYGSKHVFSGASFIIERGDRIALVGINGAGKSTLIKLLAGTEPLTSGSYTLGHNALPDYFAQDQYKELDPERRMIDDLSDAAPRATQTELRTLLGCSSASACFPAASEIATRWHGCCLRRRIFCCSMSRPITSTCAPKTCCSKRFATIPARSYSFRTTGTSSTISPREFSRLKTATFTFIPAITRIICGASKAARRRLRPIPNRKPRLWPFRPSRKNASIL